LNTDSEITKPATSDFSACVGIGLIDLVTLTSDLLTVKVLGIQYFVGVALSQHL